MKEGSPASPKRTASREDVLPIMRQDAGSEITKKPSEIIRDYVMQVSGDPKTTEYVLNFIGQQIQQKVGRVIQFGNTIFWAQQKGPKTIDVHIFTQESSKVLIKRLKEAYDWAKSHGFKVITSTLTDGNTVKLLEASGLPYTTTQTTISDGQKMIPAYQMQMEVK